MGISGLLPLLKSIHKHTTLKKFAGQTLGIDGYGWLHRGSVACAIELALDKPTAKYIEFAVNRVRMLLDFGITPYVVFDGDALPSKSGTNQERREKRNEAKRLGLSLYKAGKLSQAYQELQKATSVTPQMARLLIDELRKMNVQYIVAPYEADAQLVYLEQQGIINGILSEDSDLLVFGAKRLITKLNQYGECIEIERKDFPIVKEISLNGWTDDMFRRMAILSGCDYLPNIEKMGLKTAYRFVRKYKDPEKVVRMIAFEGKFNVPQGYLEKFLNAELTFLHHRVFCPTQQKMVFLTEPESDVCISEMPFLGEYVEPDIAVGVACGDLNPKTKLPLEVASARPRPSIRDNRRQTLGTPTELKPTKSIEAFFKPNRTPLQELDPNSLTPSPSQQRLLERHRNATWDTRFANSAPQLQRALTTSFGAPSVANTDRRSFLTRASTLSSYQSPKRQRLCSEEEFSPSKEIKQSPFFSSTAPAISPLDQKKARGRRSKREFDVWSDDSVDEILIGLSNVQQVASPQNTKSDAIDHSAEVDETNRDDVEFVPQSSPMKQPEMHKDGNSKVDDYNDDDVLCNKDEITKQPIRDEIPKVPEEGSDLQENHTRPCHRAVEQTFSAQPAKSQRSALQSLQKVQCDGPADSLKGSDKNQSNEQLASPQQISSSANVLKTFVYQSPDRQENALRTIVRTQSDATKIKLSRAAVRQHDEQKLSSVSIRDEDLGRWKICIGSEDALVPNSEDEVSESEDGALRPAIDLKGFAYKS